jgi:hypothetical protein
VPKNRKVLALMAIVIISLMMWPAPVSAEPWVRHTESAKYQVERLKKQKWKSQTAINFWQHKGRWALHTGHKKCWDIKGQKRRRVCFMARRSLAFHAARLKKTSTRLEKLTAPRDTGYLPPKAAMALGRQMAAQRGWTGVQWHCLKRLWGPLESSWQVYADNPSSDAYGIPQALPGSKMGEGWQHSAFVQIRWGLGYIAGRYGSPCSAMSYRLANTYY